MEKEVIENTEMDCIVCHGTGKMSIVRIDDIGNKKAVERKCTACDGKGKFPLIIHNAGWAKKEEWERYHFIRSKLGTRYGSSLCGSIKDYREQVMIGYEGENKCLVCLKRVSRDEAIDD